MLVLARRTGEEIVIDGNIRVKVLSVKGNKVCIAVSAPESVRVDRQEVHDRRLKELNQGALTRELPEAVCVSP